MGNQKNFNIIFSVIIGIVFLVCISFFVVSFILPIGDTSMDDNTIKNDYNPNGSNYSNDDNINNINNSAEITPENSDESRIAELEEKIRENEIKLKDPYLILVNKSNPMPEDYVMPQMVGLSLDSARKMEIMAASKLELFLAKAKEEGHNVIYVVSAYRDKSTQQTNYDAKISEYMGLGYSREDAEKRTLEFIAPPGFSEHQTALVADVAQEKELNSEKLAQTPFFIYANENIHKYGYIVRYQKGKELVTGYSAEPWHFRYVGIEAATYMHEKNLSLEEYIDHLNLNITAAEQELATLKKKN